MQGCGVEGGVWVHRGETSGGAGCTSTAWVYCSSRSSILETGRTGWDLFTLLLEGRSGVRPGAPPRASAPTLRPRRAPSGPQCPPLPALGEPWVPAGGPPDTPLLDGAVQGLGSVDELCRVGRGVSLPRRARPRPRPCPGAAPFRCRARGWGERAGAGGRQRESRSPPKPGRPGRAATAARSATYFGAGAQGRRAGLWGPL